MDARQRHRPLIARLAPPHRGHGPQAPVTSTPSFMPGSVRRTSTLDFNRTDGIYGPVTIVGSARDARAIDGGAEVLGEQTLTIDVLGYSKPQIVAVSSFPALPALACLVGASASKGLRARLRSVFEVEPGSLLAGLLNDVPSSFVVGGFAIQQASSPIPAGDHLQAIVDVCAGWQAGGAMMEGVGELGHVPQVSPPNAPAVERADEPYGWHELPPLPVMGVRRRRRMDLSPTLELDAWFRDSYMSEVGVEQVIHEYSLRGRVDPATRRFCDLRAEAHVLPWLECPQALGSTAHFEGLPIDDVAMVVMVVRRELHGTSTCTHLNSMLATLVDVAQLAALSRS